MEKYKVGEKIMKKRILIPIVALIVVLGSAFALWKTGVIFNIKNSKSEESKPLKAPSYSIEQDYIPANKAMKISDTIVKGELEGLDHVIYMEFAGNQSPCGIFRIRVSEYLLDETGEYEDIIYFSYAGTEIPYPLEEGEEFIFCLNDMDELNGDNVFGVVSMSQAMFKEGDNGKYQSTLGVDITIEEMESMIATYH